MTTMDRTEVYYDPYDVDINADPYPTYARLREEAPAYHNERYDFWALSRHADVEKALVNWQIFSNTRSDILDIIKAGVELPPGVILFEDPPLHTMHRGLMSRVFTPRRMAALEDQVREFCVGCLDPLVGSGGFDIIAELAVDAADAGHRHAARHPRSRTRSRSATRPTPTCAPCPASRWPCKEEDVASGDMFADYIEWRSEAPVRRPHDPAAQRRVRGRDTARRGR